MTQFQLPESSYLGHYIFDKLSTKLYYVQVKLLKFEIYAH